LKRTNNQKLSKLGIREATFVKPFFSPSRRRLSQRAVRAALNALLRQRLIVLPRKSGECRGCVKQEMHVKDDPVKMCQKLKAPEERRGCGLLFSRA
jgi:hypothetical protein